MNERLPRVCRYCGKEIRPSLYVATHWVHVWSKSAMCDLSATTKAAPR